MNALLLKLLSPSRSLPILAMALLLSFSADSYADSDGHGGRGGGGRGFDHGRGFDRGRGFGYRGRFGFGFGPGFYFGYPYAYGWPYYYGPGYPYYGDPYYYGGPVYRGVVRNGDSDNLVVDVQRFLKHHGYYTGGIDGEAGPGTRAAIRAYQADRHMPVTGHIDGNLIHSLGLG